MTRIIFNADDFGYTDAVTYGIVKGHQDGIIKSTTLMVNMPSTELAAKLAHANPQLFVGLHTNIVIGKPISHPSQVASLVDDEGNFNVKNRLANGLTLVYEEVLTEVRAQFKRFEEVMGYRAEHIEGHAVFDPSLQKAIMQVGMEEEIHFVDVTRTLVNGRIELQKGLHQCSYEIPDYPETAYFKENISLDFWLSDRGNLLNYDLIEMKTHPGFVDQEILDWSSYNIERVKELSIACSSELKAWLQQHQVEIISYGDLAKGRR